MKNNTYKHIPLIISDYIDDTSLLNKCDGLIINSKVFSTFNGNTFASYELFAIIKRIKEHHKKVFINVNRIIPEDEIDKFKKCILDIIDSVDYLIYSDISILNILDKKYYDKLIYDSKTLICNKEELNVIPTNAFISQVLSASEIKEFASSEKKYALDCFGYLEMMYSRRPLLSLVMPRGKTKTNTLYTLKEETRKETYKIFETKRQKNNYGTFIYYDSVYVLFKELKEISDNISFIRLNSMFLTNIIDKIITIYRRYLQDIESDSLDNYKEEFYYAKINSILENNHLSLTRGFLDQESVLLKEDRDE